MYHPLAHLGVAVYATDAPETLLLNGTGLDYPLTDGCRRFAGSRFRDVVETQGRNLTLDIDAVEQRTGDFSHIPLDLSRCADAGVRGVAIVAARTWVGGGDKHERTRIFHGIFRPRDGDDTVFKGLAKHLERLFREFCQLVEEEYSIVCE